MYDWFQSYVHLHNVIDNLNSMADNVHAVYRKNIKHKYNIFLSESIKLVRNNNIKITKSENYIARNERVVIYWWY